MAISKEQREKINKSIRELDPERAQAALDVLIERGDLTSQEVVTLKARIAELEAKLEENKPEETPPAKPKKKDEYNPLSWLGLDKD